MRSTTLKQKYWSSCPPNRIKAPCPEFMTSEVLSSSCIVSCYRYRTFAFNKANNLWHWVFRGESRSVCGHGLASNNLPKSYILFAMPNTLASPPYIALSLYKVFSFYILESRLSGTYIPILYALNFLVYSSFVSLSFWTLGGSQIGRLSMIPVIVKLC